MSICTTVFFDRKKPISVDLWAGSAADAGFELDFGEAFDPDDHSGGLPVVCRGVSAAFEFYLGTTRAYFEDPDDGFSWLEKLRIRRYSHVAEFVTGSRHDDLFAAQVAAASLAHSHRGLLLDCSSRTFVGHHNVIPWLAKEVVPPDPEDLRRREATRAVVYAWMIEALDGFGFEALDTAPGIEDTPEAKWFYRKGEQFITELIKASVASDGSESWLCLTFLGSRNSLTELRRIGLIGNAGGIYLFQHYPDDCYSWPEPPLPQNIEVDEKFPESGEASRLRGELSTVHRELFKTMYDQS